MAADRVEAASVVHGEALRRRATEHRARWEAQRRAAEEQRAREVEDEAIARALRASREVTVRDTSARPSTPRTDEPADERLCRICFSGEESGRLFSPCLCRGSIGLIHVDCLNQWRNMSRNPRSYYGCEQCGYQYNLERTRAAVFLEREEPTQVFAIIGICLLTFATALICRFASHVVFSTLVRTQKFLDAHGALASRPNLRRQLSTLTTKSVATHHGVVLYTSPCYVEVFFYRLVMWVPPWRDLRRTNGWIHSARIIGVHEYLDLLTGGFFVVALVSFLLSMYRRYQLLGARRMAEYIGPSLALIFFAHGSKGMRLPLFAGSLYAYHHLHDVARLKSRELLMRIGQRVLEVQAP